MAATWEKGACGYINLWGHSRVCALGAFEFPQIVAFSGCGSA